MNGHVFVSYGIDLDSVYTICLLDLGTVWSLRILYIFNNLQYSKYQFAV